MLSARSVVKRYGTTTALAGVSLDVFPGEVLGLVGANGAGKSTLTGVLSGTVTPTAGTVLVDGREAVLHGAADAARAGIATVHQAIDEALVAELTVAENLVLPGLVAGTLGHAPAFRRILESARRVAADRLDGIDLRAPVAELGTSDRQRVLIARALAGRPAVLILDEPTAALSVTEQAALHAQVRELAAAGTAVVFITHHLGETVAVCDRVVALRDGRVTGEYPAAPGEPLDPAALARAILGELAPGTRPGLAPATTPTTAPRPTGDPVLTLSGLRARPGGPGIELEIHAGEVVGLTGLLGAGKTELLSQIVGAAPLLTGTLTLDGRPFAPRHPADALDAGIGFVPEDRARQAEFPGWDVAESLSAPDLRRYRRRGLLSRRAEETGAAAIIDRLRIACSGPRAAVESLSGGNRQKVVVGRFFAARARLLVLDEPFRGVDIGARADIARLLRTADVEAVLVASSDPEEILEVADRVLVLSDGGIAGEVDPTAVDAETLATLMTAGFAGTARPAPETA